jgi:hypothetical protein
MSSKVIENKINRKGAKNAKCKAISEGRDASRPYREWRFA